MSGLAWRRIRRKLRRAAQGEGTQSCIHVCGPGRQLRNARQLLVHAFERRGKDLLALERLVDRTGEAPTAWLGFAPTLTLLLAYQSAFLVAQLTHADAQRFQP